MKPGIVIALLLFSFLRAEAQTQPYEFGTCFSKGNRKSIENKMDKLLKRVGQEYGSPVEKITFKVDEYYTVFYTHECRHLPKRITFDIEGKKATYRHSGLSGAITYWLLGSWSRVKE